jgi:hypothetical protein
VRSPQDKGYASYCTSSVAFAASWRRRRLWSEIPLCFFGIGASVHVGEAFGEASRARHRLHAGRDVQPGRRAGDVRPPPARFVKG